MIRSSTARYCMNKDTAKAGPRPTGENRNEPKQAIKLCTAYEGIRPLGTIIGNKDAAATPARAFAIPSHLLS